LNEAKLHIENMAFNDYNLHQYRKSISKRGVLDLNAQNALFGQNKLLTQDLGALTKRLVKLPQQLQSLEVTPMSSQQLSCELCGGGHTTGQCAYQ